jgi:hypothetical protein
MNRFLTKEANDHRDRMDRCQQLEPCPKVHVHGPGCYRPATIYAVVQEFIANVKFGGKVWK